MLALSSHNPVLSCFLVNLLDSLKLFLDRPSIYVAQVLCRSVEVVNFDLEGFVIDFAAAFDCTTIQNSKSRLLKNIVFVVM
jgi:hypothetical protein